jgi:tRNA A37 threonylcarbamoyladenosine dehydratase
MVILDNNNIAKTYEERMNKKLYIRKLVREINYKIALDILVYSKEELKMIKENGNYFIDEIERTGKIIYEKVS